MHYAQDWISPLRCSPCALLPSQILAFPIAYCSQSLLDVFFTWPTTFTQLHPTWRQDTSSKSCQGFSISEIQNRVLNSAFSALLFPQSHQWQQRWARPVAPMSSGPLEVAGVPHTGTDNSLRAGHQQISHKFQATKLEQTKDDAALLQEKIINS